MLDHVVEVVRLKLPWKDFNDLKSEGFSMKQVSILNNVIGPVMRGPSSSHTTGP